MINKKITFKVLAGFFALTSIILMSFFVYQMIEQAQTDFSTVDENGSTILNNADLEDYIDSLPTSTLTADEVEGIVYMAEEEKLARDVYLYLYNLWGANLFNNIKNSEETHMYAVDLLIDKYNITFNITEVGVFNNQTLQDLYDGLITTGQISLLDALEVGAVIEEIDIIDLVEYMDETDKEDLLFVYEILLMGSRNHLRAFVKNISNNGDSYAPQFLEQADYDNIISGDIENATNDQTSPYLFLLGSIICLLIGVIFFMQSKNQLNTKLEQ